MADLFEHPPNNNLHCNTVTHSFEFDAISWTIIVLCPGFSVHIDGMFPLPTRELCLFDIKFTNVVKALLHNQIIECDSRNLIERLIVLEIMKNSFPSYVAKYYECAFFRNLGAISRNYRV